MIKAGYMVLISKISTMPVKAYAKPNVKNIAKVALPIAGGLSVLAGASLSGMNPPINANPSPYGADIFEDPFIDYLKYQGNVALNNAGEVAGIIKDGLVDLGSDIGDGISSVGESILDSLVDSVDYLPF